MSEAYADMTAVPSPTHLTEERPDDEHLMQLSSHSYSISMICETSTLFQPHQRNGDGRRLMQRHNINVFPLSISATEFFITLEHNYTFDFIVISIGIASPHLYYMHIISHTAI